MAKETSKATRRRLIEDMEDKFPWRKIFTGIGLDVGAGDDPLQFEGCRPFDQADGNAEKLNDIIQPESLDYLHASQCLEHMSNPADALDRWLVCVKKGGHLVCTVPDFDLFEKRLWPSRWNPDHKAGFSLWRKNYPNVPLFYHVPSMISSYNIKLLRLVTTNFDFNKSDDVDQTWHEDAGVECWIEFVLQK